MITFIGAGPANIFAILYLIYKNYPAKDITLIDKGVDPWNRKEKDLLYGFGGAGFWSDGKYVFSEQQDTISEFFEDKKPYWDFIKDCFDEFHPESKTIQISKSPKTLPKIGGLQLRVADCYHLGSNWNIKFGRNIYDYLKLRGVNFYWNFNVLAVNFKTKRIIGETFSISYENLQIGLGKAGAKLIKEICRFYNIEMIPTPLHIGGRFETLYNEKIQDFVKNYQYDFKLFKRYTEDIELRTFCVNNKAAYVIQEEIDGQIYYNGFAYNNKPDKTNWLTNFAILAEVKNYNWEELKNYYFKDGESYVYGTARFESSLKKKVTKIDDFIPLLDLEDYFLDFMAEINNYFNLSSNYRIYFPEVKLQNGIVDIKSDFTLKDGRFPEVSFTGDCATGSRGLVPASITGIKAVEKLLL